MNAELLLKHYEQFADAPDAIARQRRFILDLAVRGKLVQQDAHDEPASELLKRIGKDKARLVKSGDLRKPRDLDSGGILEEPFSIPATWRWVRLDAVGAIVGGGTPSAADAENFAEPGDGVPWLTPADLGDYSDLYISRGARDLSERGLRTSSATVLPKGTVLFTSRAPIGYIAIAANPISTNQGFKSIVPYVTDCARFIATAMRAFAPEIDAKAPGTTFKEVSGKIVAAVPFPLPPLAEQHRIVAKVEELMGLCDRLEAARAVREATRDRLTAASLARINAPDPETFQTDARFALDALPALTARPDQIKQLRQTILNLAVRGKLVPQDPADEPAPVQRAHNAAELGDRLDTEIPPSWRWVRVEDVADARLGKMLDKAKNKGRPYPYLRNTNVHWFDIRLDDLKTIPLDDAEFEEYRLKNGDVLICEGGHGIGRTAVWRGGSENLVFQKALHRVRPGEHLEPNFFAQCCFVYFDARIMQTYFTGVGIPHFTGRALAKLVFPLPSLAEQRRIVAKVDALMGLCDRLEASLIATAATRRHLLDALLAEVLARAEDRELEAAE
ncbi:restriction endonuclease subunit S [soil metagenome]